LSALQIYQEKRKLTIGFYVDDGNLMSAPACQRAVLEVKAILQAQKKKEKKRLSFCAYSGLFYVQ
jgi:hypothetical protein